MVGIVNLRKEFQFTSIDIDFQNKQFHRNLVIADDFGISMSVLNYSGVLLASKAEEKDADDYEDDELDDDMVAGDLERRKKNSNI
jgi:hypothetical protein